MLVGITGGSGSGKSLVSEEFRKADIPVIDADLAAREVTEKGSPALKEITDTFGSEYISEDGALLRKKLGSLVFSDASALEKLNGIINRYIRENIDEKIKACKTDIVCLDAPLLIEYGMDERCDVVIVVLADKKLRAERIKIRDNISAEDAQNRIRSQHEDKFYLEKADYIVYNNSGMERVRAEVNKIIAEIKKQGN